VALSAFAAPILEGKLAQWRELIREIGEGGSRHEAYVASRQAMGVRERPFLQQTPMGDLVIVTLEGDDPGSAMAKIANGNDEFSQWFVAQVQEIHGFDLRQVATQPGPEMAVDSGPVLPKA
jgi:hypothetical protein